MLTQRQSDIALVEAKLEVQQLLQEWARDYLGSRYGNRQGQLGEDSTQDAETEQPSGSVPQGPALPY